MEESRRARGADERGAEGAGEEALRAREAGEEALKARAHMKRAHGGLGRRG